MTSTRSCTPEGSCIGDFLKEEPCQEELLHIDDNGDLVEPSKGHSCPSSNFSSDAHCLCNKGERVASLETRFEEASTDRIWILQCEQIAFQLQVNNSYPPSFSILFPFEVFFLFPSSNILKGGRREMDQRNNGNWTTWAVWVGRHPHRFLSRWVF